MWQAEAGECSMRLCEGLNQLLPLLKAALRQAAASSSSLLPPGLSEEAGLLLVEARRASASSRKGEAGVVLPMTRQSLD